MSYKKKLLLSQLICLPFILFLFYMAILCAIRSSINYKDLSHVKGVIKEFRHITHYESPGKYERKIRKLDVIAFKVDGFDDEFGIIERDDDYSSVRDILTSSAFNTIDMYYNPKGTRIEFGITLHIFELKLNNSVIYTLQDTNDSDRKGILLFGLIGLLFCILDFFVIKGLNKVKYITAN